MGIFNVPISKANASIEIDTDAIPQKLYEYALLEGLKVVLTKGMSKITTAKLEGEQLAKARAAALAKANENKTALLDGTLKIGRGAKAKSDVPAKVMTEARRLAKADLKDMIREAGMKISAVPAKELTEGANKLIEADPKYIEQAKTNLEARESAPKPKVDVKSLVAESPALLAKIEAENAAKRKNDGTLSAKQAGKTGGKKGKVPPAKPQAPEATAQA